MKNYLSIFSIFLLVFSGYANANLIMNGGFENNDYDDAIGGSGFWRYYSSPDVEGWDGSNIELWKDRGAYEGSFHAELNAHGQQGGVYAISQTFDTVAGLKYDIFFAYKARLGGNDSNESFDVTVDNLNLSINDHITSEWFTYNGSFIADDTSATLTFTQTDWHRFTYGNFLDDVRVTAVPEPSILALLGFGLLGLSLSRRRIKA